MKQVLAIKSSDSFSVAAYSRLSSLDIQRGFIMMLMALSHGQELVGIDRHSNNEWNEAARWTGSSFELLYQTFSLAASGGFFLMMGMGITFLVELRLQQGQTLEKVCQYLVLRGSFIVFLQLSILQVFEFIAEKKIFFYMGVLFALGGCMIFASAIIYICRKIKIYMRLKSDFILYFFFLFFALLDMICSQLVIDNIHGQGASASVLQMLLLLGGKFEIAGWPLEIDFTPIPWFPGVAIGLIIGQIIYTHRSKALQIFSMVSGLLLIFCLFIRLGNVYGWFTFGDYKFFTPHDEPVFSSLFTMTKYPPSISYYLWSLGINLAFIALWQKTEQFLPVRSRIFGILQVYGRSALFFFVAHWFVYYALSILAPMHITSTMSFLPIWLLGLLILYVMCQAFSQFKMKQAHNSWWRFF